MVVGDPPAVGCGPGPGGGVPFEPAGPGEKSRFEGAVHFLRHVLDSSLKFDQGLPQAAGQRREVLPEQHQADNHHDEQFRYAELLGKAPFAVWDEDAVRAVLGEMHKLATEVLGPLNPVGDRVGCRLEGGQVYTPPGPEQRFKKLAAGP